MKFNDFIQIVSDITNFPAENIQEKTHFRNDLGIDSLNMVNLFIKLSEKTGVGFEKFVAGENIQTVGSVFEMLKEEK